MRALATYESKQELLVVALREIGSAEQEYHNDRSLRNSKQVGLELSEPLREE